MCSKIYTERAQGHGEKHVGDGEHHEPDVAADVKSGVRGNELCKLESTLPKCTECKGRINERDESEEYWPHEYKEIGWDCVVNGCITPDVLQDIIAMWLNDIVECHDEKWDADSDTKIDYDGSTFVRTRDGDVLNGGDSM